MEKEFSIDIERKIGAYWSQRSLNKQPRWNWWSSRQVIRHINRRICSIELKGVSQGVCYRAKEMLLNQQLEVGISVGCGNGFKEMNLIQWGLVKKMICFELSEQRISQGQEEAKRRSLSEFIEFRREDAFLGSDLKEVDLVHWNNSLHHMPDTFKAVEWSRKMLKTGGLFMMDDYVGPNYTQFSDKSLEFASELRMKFPTKYLIHPSSSADNIIMVDTKCKRPDLSKVIAKDPSEAADSESILPAVNKIFPNAEITLTGGVVYFIALPPLYANFDPTDDVDTGFLASLLTIDELYTQLYPEDTLYATALAIKD